MIPSVTNGAIIGSAASKKHEKLPRGSLATMIVLPRTTESSRGTSRSCLLMTARMVPIFPGAFQKCMQGTTVQQYLRSFSANTTTQRGSRNKPDRGMPAEPPAAKISVRERSTFSENRCSPACCRAAHHTYQPWRGGCRRPCWRDPTFSTVVSVPGRMGSAARVGNCHMYLASRCSRLPVSGPAGP